MYLKKLDILGFKSFLQKTEIEFNPGLTAIVGPNGCGKTNIVDALRWCLGEQKSSTLRSDKMENVIFNGTNNRKPMGMAEVSLTIENDKGILPTEYSEVSIARRIFRSGESEYLLNKNLCRLKDITNLFMDTGMGSNAYSVIELKMVETILSNKADERRIMFEEAAGVNKYKLRRRLTLKKLDEVKSDLTRVNDIVSEVEKKVNSLERQAKRASKYSKLSTDLRELELDLAGRELALFVRNKSEIKISRSNFLSQKIQIESDLSKLEDELKEIKQNLGTIEQRLNLKRSEIANQTQNLYKLDQSISVAKERKNSLQENISRFTNEIEELKQRIKNTEAEIHISESNLNSISTLIELKHVEKISAEDIVKQKKETLEKVRESVKQIAAESLIKFKEVSTKENELSNLVKSLERTNSSINSLNNKIQSLTGNIAKTVGFIEELSVDKVDVEKKLAEAEEIYGQKQKEKEGLERNLAELKSREINEKGIISGIKDKISFFKNLIDNLEGFSKGAKSLLDNQSWTDKEKNLLANIGDAKQDYRFAIEAALKNNLNNILVENIDDVKKGIEFLNSHDYGKAAFYVFNGTETENKSIRNKVKIFFFNRNKKKLQAEKGFLGWADELIQTDNKWKPFFKKILSSVAVFDNLENAFPAASNNKMFDITTLNGDLIYSSGIIEGGSQPKLDETLFGRKQLLENLLKEIPERESELRKLRQQIEELESEIAEIDLKVLSEKGRILINDLANVEKQIAQFEYEKQKAVDDSERTSKEIQELASTSNKLDNDRELLEQQFLKLKEIQRESESQKLNVEEEFKLIETEFNIAVKSQNDINLEFERQLGEKKNLENAISYGKNTIQSIENTIVKRETEIKDSSMELLQIDEAINEQTFQFNEMKIISSTLKKEEEEIEGLLKGIKTSIEIIENKQNHQRKERELLSNNIHESDIKTKELDMKIENLRDHINENYSLHLELKEYDDLDLFDFKGRSDEVHALKQQIRNLGPINSLAYSEYEEEKQRLDFLTKQRDDLLESEKDLARTIEEINNTAHQLFFDTFEKIRENFINIFRNLFNPGDEADLKLEENADVLEAKIEIVAKPKGKRPTSIELLSGGEKTLTAIALLFAIYLVKPSPFCILDEIDAPLDDANIDRFTKILKDFSSNTQFIVVTHNKRTMEACETLYGVTMQEEGVSKLVAVRFNEELNFVR